MDCEQIMQIAQNSKSWVDYLSALLVPTIAIFGLIIGFLQWKTNANRLKHELFDRRYEKFEGVSKFISSVYSYDRLNPDHEMKFLSITKGVNFIFDKKIKQCIDDIWHLAINISHNSEELDTMEGQQRKGTSDKKQEFKKQFKEKEKELEGMFSKYLQLK